jgi:hypothetical protein
MAGNNGSASGALTVTGQQGDILYNIVIGGDLSSLNSAQKMGYYNQFCETLGLNPITRPFEFIRLQGKEVLYAKKDATEQLRKIHGVSVEDVKGEKMDDLYIVTVKVRDKEGRTDMSSGVLNISGAKGEALANLMMKAETKAKRRATLSICGLGILDESEIEDAEREPKIIHAVEKKVGKIEPAMKAISETKTTEEVEKYETLVKTRSWTDEELFKLEELLKSQKLKVMVNYEPDNSAN